jgi:Hr1 repeat
VRSNEQLETSLEERIEELRHRLRIEAAVVDGAKNVIRTLQSNKTIDKKALQEVSTATSFIKFIFDSAGSHNFRALIAPSIRSAASE